MRLGRFNDGIWVKKLGVLSARTAAKKQRASGIFVAPLNWLAAQERGCIISWSYKAIRSN